MKNDLIKPGLLVAAHTRDPNLITDSSACPGKVWTTILWQWHAAADGSEIIEQYFKIKSSNQTQIFEWHNTKCSPDIYYEYLLWKIFVQKDIIQYIYTN